MKGCGRNVHLARPIEKVRLDRAVRRIKQGHAIDEERIPVIVRGKRLGGCAPDALRVFLHREWCARLIDLHADVFRIGGAQPERHAMIGVNLR